MKAATWTAHAAGTFLVAGLTAGLTAGCAQTASSPRGMTAGADLADVVGKFSGRATITESADGLWLDVRVRGVAPGAHGLHVHTTGKCDVPDFASAGGHWNPSAHQHGRKNPQGPHAGDAPNLVADAAGKGALRTWLGAGTIMGTISGTGMLLDADGATVILHADADDEQTDPSGKSGRRILCGVLSAPE